MTQGIDVSTFQGTIDWRNVKANGIDFSIIRAGYGRDISQKDEKFEQNYQGCRTNNINTGAYWYSYATSPEDARLEASACLNVLAGKVFEYPVYFDIEDKVQASLPKNRIQDITVTFCNILESAGYWVGIYSYKSFLETNFTKELLERYSVWVAHTGVSKTNYSHPYGIWQYSHNGKIDGINGAVDLNYSYTDYPDLIRSAGKNGYIPNDDTQYILHTVRKNESLWSISEKYLGNGTRYPEIKVLNNLSTDTIYEGQVLKIINE